MAERKGVFDKLKKPAPVLSAEPSPMPEAAEAETASTVEVEAPRPKPSTSAARPTTRQDLVSVSCFLPRDVHKRLKLLAVEEDTEIQHLLIDGLNALFKDRGDPPIPKPPKVKRGPKPG